MSTDTRNLGGRGNAPLFTRTMAGRYRLADRDEVCSAAAGYLIAEAAGTSYANSPASTHAILRARLAGLDREAFAVVWLNNRHGVIGLDVLFQGALDRSQVCPRVIARKALERNAAAVVLAHNHPSGILEPSSADELVTKRIREALQLLDVRVVDHLIFSAQGYLSFSEKGLL